MNKQDFLDQTSTNDKTWVTQQMLITYSKTDIIALNRAFRKLNNTLYKSWSKVLPLHEIIECSELAERLITKDTTDPDKDINTSIQF